VKIVFDPKVISYRELLKIFFTTHDPTTKNRQGNDVGSQYRSIIIYMNEEQRKIAEEEIKEAEKIWKKKVVTEITPFKAFYKAEDYHINYYERNPYNPYCIFVISPKVSKFEKVWKEYLRILNRKLIQLYSGLDSFTPLMMKMLLLILNYNYINRI